MKATLKSIYNKEKRRELLYHIFFRSEDNVLWTTNTETIKTTTSTASGSEASVSAGESKERMAISDCALTSE